MVMQIRSVLIKCASLNQSAPVGRAPKRPPQARGSPANRAKKSAKTGWKVELCPRCYIRKDNALTIVFIQHPDGSSEEFHGGRKNGSKTKSCPLVQSDLSKDEKTVWKRAMQKLQRDGKLLELYEEHVSLAL